MKMRRLALSMVLLALPAAHARAAAPGGRTVADVLADVVKALGPASAWKAHKNVRMKLEMSFQGMGITGTGERFATKDDKALVVTDLPGMGTIKEGSNGKVAWAQDPINGLRELSGAEAEQARLDAAWNAELRMNELYKSIELAPGAGPAGTECLRLTPRESPPVVNCYDAKTHLQVSQKGTKATPQGDTPFTSTLKDWRDVGGLEMPFSVDTQAGPITFSAKLIDVKFDQPMPDSMFEPPTPPGGADAKAKSKVKGKPHAKKP